MACEVVFEVGARADLDAIADWVAGAAGTAAALAYIGRLEAKCRTLRDFPERGRQLSDRRGLRSIPFERRATIVYRVDGARVIIVGIYHSGRRIELD